MASDLVLSLRAREGNRTLDLRITSALLCRLSYSGGTCHSSSAASTPSIALFYLVNPHERAPHHGRRHRRPDPRRECLSGTQTLVGTHM